MRKAFVFDLDGTLLDTLADIAASANRLFEAHGWPVRDLEACRLAVGCGFTRLVRLLLPPEVSAVTDEGALAELAAEGRTYYADNPHEATRPYPGMTEALRRLAGMGFALAVVTNKPDEVTQRLIPLKFPDIPFSCILGATSELPLKPHPDMAHRALRALRLGPDECFYVGDSNVDMLTARGAGMPAVGVAWGFRGEEEVRVAGARWIARDTGDLIRLAEGRLDPVRKE